MFGPEKVWRVFGDPDLGDVDFATLSRRASPNDALVCSPDVCPARADAVAPVYPVPARALFEAIPAALAAEARLEMVQDDPARLKRRYIQRTKLLGFPDTIVMQVIERPGGGSAVAMYSRSQLGFSDLGANRARLDRWLEKISLAAARAK